MDWIKLEQIQKDSNTIIFHFSVSQGLQRFFSDSLFRIDYPFSVLSIPDAVLTVPFVCCVLPIIWITNANLIVPELDKAFYECIPNVKAGYQEMYPETAFLGSIEVGNIITCNQKAISGKSAMLFSGGADSLDTLYRHLDETPSLISIWGSDIKYDNVEGWQPLNAVIQDAAKHYKLPSVIIRSTFRGFDKEWELDKAFSAQLRDGWWHGVKHGIALLGHVAPYAYLHNLEKMYIASSHCPEDGHVRCASNPSIDNHVRFASCSVIHDGFDYSRQEKIRNIVQYATAHNDYFPLHVCWETQTGKNCCHCEKCFRTIIAIIAEGGDPAKFGFPDYEKHLPELEKVLKKSHPDTLKRFWPHIQKRILQRKEEGIQLLLKRNLRFLVHADFNRPEFLTTPLSKRVRRASGLRGKLSQFRTYQKLHDLKEKIK